MTGSNSDLPGDLADWTSGELRAGYADRRISPVEVTEAVLRRAEARNPELNFLVFTDAETTMVMARESEARWARGEPLGLGDGVPVTIKDNMLAAGWPTRAGSHATAAAGPASQDSPSVARLREQGCVFIGKTATPEFAWKGITDSPLNGISRNPVDANLTPGGSSGGAAAAAALGIGRFHTASDAAGSIRIPAAFCGVYGLKPTFGMVPLHPSNAFTGLGHHGPIAGTLGELGEMFDIIRGSDRRDGAAVPPDALLPAGGGLRGKRIGFADPCGFTDGEVRAALLSAVEAFASLGAEVTECHLDLSGARDIVEIYWRVGCALIVDGVPPERREAMDAGLLRKAELGRHIPATEFRRAEIARDGIASALSLLFRDHDLLLTPTVPIPPFRAGQDVPDGFHSTDWIDWAAYAYPFNLSQQPALSFPFGRTASGLPIGLQLVGPRFADRWLLLAADALGAARSR